jgi:hypothetical protein
MGLEIIEQAGVELGPAPEQWTSDRKLWKTADGDVVEDGDARAAFLFATEGTLIPLKQAEELGLVKPKKKAEPKEEETKQAAKPQDKKRTTAKNKSKKK